MCCGSSSLFRVAKCWHEFWWLLVVTAFFVAGAGSRCFAQDEQDKPTIIGDSMWSTMEGSEPWPEELFVVDDLPEPTEEIAKLWKAVHVEFKFYDAEQIQRRFSAETRMAMKYRLDFEFRWQMAREGGKRHLLVTIDHRPTKFELFHQILLPKEHATSTMYSVPLVLHELDHVRITADPRYPALFDQWFQEKTTTLKIELKRQARERDFEALIQEEMQTNAEGCFERMLQMIEIRNRELDRLSRHGRVPLPVDFFGNEDGSVYPTGKGSK